MADALKLQKLAAARKKLKGHQEKKNKVKNEVPESSSSHSSENYNLQPENVVNIAENYHLQTDSSVNTYFTQDVERQVEHNVSPIQNYFNTNTNNIYKPEPIAFFDNVPTTPNNYFINPQSENIVNTPTIPPQSDNYMGNYNDFNNYNVSNYFSNVPSNEIAAEDPEINLNMFTNQNIEPHNIITNEDANTLSAYLTGTASNQVEIVEPKIEENCLSQRSSVESLRQLSSQINQYIEPTYEGASNYSDLEKRNLELASLYETEKLKSEQLNVDLHEYKNRLQYSEKELFDAKNSYDNKMSGELGPLQEQLQCHMQTVGILVGDKTELSASLSQSQLELKQKNFDCEELQARLKTSRSRVADLEKELGNLRNEKHHFDQLGSEQTEEQSKLKSELINLRENYEEAQQDISELREKLKVLTNENTTLHANVQGLNSQISLSNIKIQQLSMNGSVQVDSQLETLTQDKIQLEKNILELNLMLKNAVNERDQASNQYQQYVQQLNTNLSSLAEKLEATTTENENLSRREQELLRYHGELEKHLQTLQNEHSNFSNNNKSVELKKEYATSQKQLEDLQTLYITLQEQYDDLIGERDDLFKDLEIKKDLIQRMEENFEQMQDNQSDNTKLLATIESDKVAASRAVQQNVQLKQQLEEMEEAFIKMTNDKAELADKLTTEQFKLKEMDEKISQHVHQTTTLAEAIVIKDRELTEMRENSSELNKQVLQQNQLTDRLRHYEANEHSSQSLIADLQNALKEVELLKLENKELKEHDLHHHHAHESIQVKASSVEDDLQIEIFNLKQKIDGLEIVNQKLNNELQGGAGVDNVDDSETGEVLIENDVNVQEVGIKHVDSFAHGHSHGVSQEIGAHEKKMNLNNSSLNELNRELATRQLEAKFMRTMQDIANLQDEKQMLEHLVLQLQDETETIGEYIALYQHQRGVLKQRALEKEEQLKQLALDREQMKVKLNQLNALVRRLVLEKGAISGDVLEQHELLNKQTTELCDEHARLHQEMQDGGESKETAAQILALLSEIKTSNLVQPANVSDSFKPCPWCSGQLITV